MNSKTSIDIPYASTSLNTFNELVKDIVMCVRCKEVIATEKLETEKKTFLHIYNIPYHLDGLDLHSVICCSTHTHQHNPNMGLPNYMNIRAVTIHYEASRCTAITVQYLDPF